MLAFFLWVWIVYSSACALTFVWGLARGWEIEILMPLAFFFIGSGVWWIIYLIADKIAQHVTIH